MENKQSESEILYNNLKEKFTKLSDLENAPVDYPDYDSSNPDHDAKVSNLEFEIILDFPKLYEQSMQDNYFWEYCPFNVYEANYKQRLNEFYLLYPDASETDFLNEELQLLNTFIYEKDYIIDKELNYVHPIKIKTFGFEKRSINELIGFEMVKKIEFSQKKKIEFIKTKIEIQQKGIIDKSNNKSLKNEIYIDYSDNTDAEKIVFMNELGIVDYLRQKQPFNTSTNKLAEVISAFTGIKQTTAQSYLNPILSGIESKNNPLTPVNLSKVKEKLIRMGYIPK